MMWHVMETEVMVALCRAYVGLVAIEEGRLATVGLVNEAVHGR